MSGINRNVLLLAASQALMLSAVVMLLTLATILGGELGDRLCEAAAHRYRGRAAKENDAVIV